MYSDSLDEHPLLGEEEFSVEPTYLLQAIALIRSGQCKKGDLLLLERERFEEDWHTVCAAASSALSVLRGDCGVLTRHWLPYASLFPSLFAAATHLKDMSGPAVGQGWEKLRRWFWCCSFGQRYEGPVNSLNASDYAQLRDWLAGSDEAPESVASFRLQDVSLRGIERQRNAAYRAVICLTIVNGAHDFFTGNRLTEDFLNDPSRRIEDHHLFPSGFLRKADPPRKAMNSILNRCLIDHTTNKLISDRRPSDYLGEMERQLGADKLEAVLASHLIPYEGKGALSGDDLDAFLDMRENLLLGAIAGVTGAELSTTEPKEAYLDPSRPFTNELALRKVLRSLTGDVLWYEQHMSRKSLELLSEEIDKDNVSRIRLLSGPAHADEKARRAFRRFAEEMQNLNIEATWRVLPTELAQPIHARVIFSDAGSWELPPVNLLLMGTVDSIHPSGMDRDPFEAAWQVSVRQRPRLTRRPRSRARRSRREGGRPQALERVRRAARDRREIGSARGPATLRRGSIRRKKLTWRSPTTLG